MQGQEENLRTAQIVGDGYYKGEDEDDDNECDDDHENEEDLENEDDF